MPKKSNELMRLNLMFSKVRNFAHNASLITLHEIIMIVPKMYFSEFFFFQFYLFALLTFGNEKQIPSTKKK